jgi:tetraacyldisaccharide 4'-kinase
LPRGPLREPRSALARAHCIGVVDGPLGGRDVALLDEHTVAPFRFEAHRRPARLRPLAGGKAGKPSPAEDPDVLAGLRIGMLAALGQPAAFHRTLEDLGATVIAQRTFRDHHRYRPRDLRSLRREADVWVTTEKDAVKILPGWVRGVDLRVLTIDLTVDAESAFLDWLEQRLGAGCDAR